MRRALSPLQMALLAAGAALLALLAWGAVSPGGVPAFFWRHFAGPVAAQAEGHPVTWNGIPATVGYSAPSLLGYGALLALGLAAVDALLLRRLGLRLDWGFAIALAPFFAFGPLVRALQVTGYFSTPDGAPTGLAYALVEPAVYLTTALLAGLALAWGATLARAPLAGGRRVAVEVAGLALVALLLYALLALGGAQVAPSAWVPLLAVPVAYAVSAGVTRALPRAPAAGPSLALGLVVLSFFLVAAVQWSTTEPWTPPRPTAGGGHPWVLPVVLAAAAALALALAAGARLVGRKAPRARDAGTAAAALLVFGHLVDGLSTIVGVKDPFGWGLPRYSEQNPVSLLLLEVGNGWGFVVAKVLLAVGVAMLLADYARKEAEDKDALAELLPLAYIAVFALGWGPGFTNLLRTAFGV